MPIGLVARDPRRLSVQPVNVIRIPAHRVWGYDNIIEYNIHACRYVCRTARDTFLQKVHLGLVLRCTTTMGSTWLSNTIQRTARPTPPILYDGYNFPLRAWGADRLQTYMSEVAQHRLPVSGFAFPQSRVHGPPIKVHALSFPFSCGTVFPIRTPDGSPTPLPSRLPR